MKQADLCGRCAALFDEHYKLTRISGGRENKVTCEKCGKRRYGGTYEITLKKRKTSQ